MRLELSVPEFHPVPLLSWKIEIFTLVGNIREENFLNAIKIKVAATLNRFIYGSVK